MPGSGNSQYHREVFRPGAGHNRDNRNMLYRIPDIFPGSECETLNNYFIGGSTGTGQHLLHTLFGGENNRQTVRPAIFIEQLL
jgi:hypothetical protein